EKAEEFNLRVSTRSSPSACACSPDGASCKTRVEKIQQGREAQEGKKTGPEQQPKIEPSD
ncbi:MAG: hypothetical protein VX743_07660, partial [Actinomycetota bacterium]|nr:hypothetical protein [Actinomycetota bacterium]